MKYIFILFPALFIHLNIYSQDTLNLSVHTNRADVLADKAEDYLGLEPEKRVVLHAVLTRYLSMPDVWSLSVDSSHKSSVQTEKIALWRNRLLKELEQILSPEQMDQLRARMLLHQKRLSESQSKGYIAKPEDYMFFF